MGKQFRVGDRVIGNVLASEWYGVTKKGWKGIVTQVDYIRGRMTVKQDTLSFRVKPEAFDLVERGSTVAPSTTEKSVLPSIKKVIFNNPATVVIWNDDTKTVVKCQPRKNGKLEKYDKEKGLALCIAKKVLGNKSSFNNTFKKWTNQ